MNVSKGQNFSCRCPSEKMRIFTHRHVAVKSKPDTQAHILHTVAQKHTLTGDALASGVMINYSTVGLELVIWMETSLSVCKLLPIATGI